VEARTTADCTQAMVSAETAVNQHRTTTQEVLMLTSGESVPATMRDPKVRMRIPPDHRNASRDSKPPCLDQGIVNPRGSVALGHALGSTPEPGWRSHAYMKCVGAEPSMPPPRSAVAAERVRRYLSPPRRPWLVDRPRLVDSSFQAHAGAQDGRGVRGPGASCAVRLDRLPGFRRLGA